MSSLWQDIRFSFRTLSKSPGFTLMAVLTMALGICALSSIFSVFNAVLLRQLPYEDPGRLVLVDGRNVKDDTQRWQLSYQDFFDLRDRASTFESLAARTESRNITLRTSEGPAVIKGEIVTASYFSILGIKPASGRTFLPEEDRAPAVRRVALLSNEIWHTRFGGDGSIVGRTVTLDDLDYTVVGILPPGFRGLTDEAQVWLPLSVADTMGKNYATRGVFWLNAVGRLKPDASLEQAQQDLDTVMRQLERGFPDTNQDLGARVKVLSDVWFGELSRKLYVLLAGGLFLLLIVCTNLANLLLARFVARRRDLSLRMALGAGRRGLVRQILTESVLLALLGSVAGLVITRWSAGLLVRASGIQLRSFVNVNVDLVVVGVILTVSVLAGLLFGLVPALVLSTRLRLYEIFNETGRRSSQSETHNRLQSMLIISEVALALVLLVCAGLMTKGFQRLTDTKLGFDEQRVLTVRINTKGEGYKDDATVQSLIPQIRQRIGALPGVRSVALEGPYMPTDDWFGMSFSPEDRPESERPVPAVLHFVSPGYFDTLGVKVRGRDLEPLDTPRTTWVAVINQSMADGLWPGQSALGKRILVGQRSPDNTNPWLTVVGVVPDLQHSGLVRGDQRPKYDVYQTLLQKVPRRPSTLSLLVRTDGDPAALTTEVMNRLHEIAPDLPVYDPMTMEARLSAQTQQNRSFVLLMSLFAFFALALAAVGVYGVVSYSVANRTQEIGVRMALGAQLRDVLRLVVAEGGRLALVGVALGLLLAALVTPVLQNWNWLYGVSPLDKVILVGMSLLLLGVAVAASYIPARRAAKVAPFQALRLE